ncbi:virulence associated protein [Burkholderia ubonensis]|uniref:virulence associated protein n=1 Tax=Burkholderia ubonensis TaxID=101571 RepID=UPI000ABA4146|nr:virulence associated protein [Burkholderia ubonensis]
MKEIPPATGSSGGSLVTSKSEVSGEPPCPWIACLTSSGAPIATGEGKQIQVLQFTAPTDEAVLSAWAKSFRQRYCLDQEIDDLRDGPDLSRKDYLLQLVFPDASIKPGPSIRAGDFAELLVSDYVEHVLGYWVPQGKFADKEVRNESVKGVDILGFICPDPSNPHPDDSMLAFEVKALLSGKKYVDRLQVAVDDSSKDYLRRAESLNATKRRLLRANEQEKASVVRRFQRLSDRPYQYRSGAAAMLSGASFDPVGLMSTTTKNHRNAANLQLLVIKGTDLMTLVTSLYERAANEA